MRWYMPTLPRPPVSRWPGRGSPADVLPEIALLMGEVPCVPYATAGTPSLGNAAEPFLDRHVVLLLATMAHSRGAELVLRILSSVHTSMRR